MRIFQLSLIALVAAAAALRIEAQPASPEVQAKALELLRQTLSEQKQEPAPAMHAPAATSPAVPMQSSAPQPAPAVAPPTAAPIQPASPQLQDQAIARLRATLEQERSAQRPPMAGTQPRPPMPATNHLQPEPKSGAAGVHNALSGRPASRPEAVVTPAAPDEPSGPKTKQQKLMELLEMYKADKLTPAEYQAQRAKILAEP